MLATRLAAAFVLVAALLAVSVSYAGVGEVLGGIAVSSVLLAAAVALAEYGPALSRRRRSSRLRIFVSYPAEQEQAARRLARELDEHATVWLDKLPAHLAAPRDRGDSPYEKLIRTFPHSNPLYRQLRAGGIGADRLEAADILVLVGSVDLDAAAAEIRLAHKSSAKVVRVDIGPRRTARPARQELVDQVVEVRGNGARALADAAKRVLSTA